MNAYHPEPATHTAASLAVAASVRHEDLEQLKGLVRTRCQESRARVMNSRPPSSDAPQAELSAFVGAVQSQQTLEHATRLAVEQRAFGLVAPAGSNRASHLQAQLSVRQRLQHDAPPPPPPLSPSSQLQQEWAGTGTLGTREARFVDLQPSVDCSPVC